MIGKAKSNKSLQATIAYNEKEKATVVYANKLVGMSLADFQMQMEDLQKCYRGYGKQLTIHAILSPSIEDGKKLTISQWQTIAGKYLTNMNMQALQAIGFLHADKEHKHLHLVINKVKEENFKLFHDSYVGKKSQKAADTIASDMKLIRAMEVRQARINQLVRVKDALQTGISVATEKPIGTKQQFKSILEAVVKNNYGSIDEYFAVLRRSGFKVHSYSNKETGELRGYGVEMNGVKMDASDIGKKFTLKALKISERKIDQIKTKDEEEATLNVSDILPLKDIAKITVLENYAKAMGIPKEVLKNNKDIELVEHNKKFFIALKNDSGGYEMNNVFSKVHHGENNITTKFINKEYPTVVIEDIFSYLFHKQQHEQFNYIILNSITNKDKLINKLTELNVNDITFQLNDDPIGKLLTKEISNAFKNILNDTKINWVSGNKQYPSNPKKNSRKNIR
jgi:relaxase-like protein